MITNEASDAMVELGILCIQNELTEAR